MPKQVKKKNTEPETRLSDAQLDKAAGGAVVHACNQKLESMAMRELIDSAPSGQGELSTASSADVGIETIELAHEGLERE